MAAIQKLVAVFFMFMVALSSMHDASVYADPILFGAAKVEDNIKPIQFHTRKLMADTIKPININNNVLGGDDILRINVMHGLGECLPDQKAVLLQIQNQLSYNSSLSFKLVRWDERVDCCQWPGSLEPITGGTNAFFLLKLLPYLSVIRLDRLNFSAPFPDFFADFTNLTVLSLRDCNFTGTVPQKVFQVPTLQTIDLSSNEMLGGSLPDFPKNGSLQSLQLGVTKFSGRLPESIGNLRLLSHIELIGCNFSGPIPVSIIRLTKLVELSLRGNHFSGWIPPFKLFKNLTEIDLSNNDFTGEIPSSHWDGLNNLERLYLDGNSFSGPIPPSLFFLPSLITLSLYKNKFSSQIIDLHNVTSPLELLYLSDNNLEGTMPSFFFQLPNLTYLDLSSNKFSGQIIDLQNVSSQLRNLDLSNNNLEGPIPSFFFQLQNLTTLYLSSNKFNGTVHLTRFKNPENIWFLDISHNSLAVETNIRAAELPILPEFRVLKLASCNLQKFPDFLKNQSKLQMLDLSSNAISGEIPEWISEMGTRNLIFLNLSRNLLDNMQEPKEYGSLYYLDLNSNMFSGHIPRPPRVAVYLDLSNNSFSSLPLDIGDQLPNVSFFSIANNRVSGTIPLSWCHANQLEVLDLSNNALHGNIPPCLVQNNSKLAVMNLKGNHLSGEMPQDFLHSCSLETLDVSQNLLEGRLPPSLVNCTELKVLNLGNNRVSDTFPCWLDKLSNLHILVLRWNRFHGSISCPKLGVNNSWPSLQVIDLSSNNFSGNLPADLFLELKAILVDRNAANSKVGYLHFKSQEDADIYYQDSVSLSLKGQGYTIEKILSIFTSIDFSSNQFEGGIPESVGELKLLYLLNLSRNALIGGIPRSLENLRDLEALDLSVNSLTGNIPEQLESLTFLSFLNLSYNHLFGRIPQGKQFSTFDTSSFMGNKGLCGFQLNVSCNPINKPEPEEKESAYHGDIYASVALGFVVGLGGIFLPLLLSNKWRLYYNKKIDGVVLKVFFQRDKGRRKNSR
ncbi:receptor like protein 22-like [Ipomoea triloba]|uniref:receptor like protein 22-like n=1 Tax=Ipomoea triloba TaxID=35885 RepID=UPI00125E8090|nr:receptor like protein 22-like [Ipomoea triloba]